MLSRLARWTGFDGARANAFDVGRGIAIVSVLYGHALAPWFMDAGGHFSEDAFLQWKFGASFMLCFFFFLSGAGWRQGRSLETTFRQALTLVLLTWLASVAFDVAQLAITLVGAAPAFGIEPVDPVRLVRNAARMAIFGDAFSMSALWFLVALAIVRVLAALAVRLGKAVTAVLAIALLVLSLAATELYWRNIHQVTLIGVAFASFLAGHAAIGWLKRLTQAPGLAFAVMLGGGAVAWATFDLNQGCRWDAARVCGEAWLNDGFGVSMILGQFGNLPLFALTAAAGVLFAAGLSVVLAHNVAGARFASWGRNSLNLLIVNCVFLELANPAVSRWIVPNVAGDGLAFFFALLAVILVVNLTAAALAKRPLRQLQGFATATAGRLVDGARRAGAIVASRADRVSRAHEQP